MIVSEPGSERRKGRPRDPRFAAYYQAVRRLWPEIESERGRHQKARALYVFAVLRRAAPDLLPWFASGHTWRTKVLAALSRFDEPSIVLVARQIVADDMSVLDAVAFCDEVVKHANSGVRC